MVVVMVVTVLVVAMWSPSFVVVVTEACGSLFFGLVLVLVLFTLVVVLLIVLIVLPVLPIIIVIQSPSLSSVIPFPFL
jgi:hypothetical protein